MNIATSSHRFQQKVSCFGTDYTITVNRQDSGGIVGMFEGAGPAGDGPPVHIHHNEDEVIHVLQGEYEIWLDGRTRRLGPGQSIFLPRGVPHTFRILGNRPGRNLGIVTPGGFEHFFVDVASQGLRLPDDMAALEMLGQRYGLELLGPARWPDK